MVLGICLLIPLILTSCSAYGGTEQSAHPDLLELSAKYPVGQTFVSRYDGLQGISIFLRPTDNPPSEVIFELFTSSKRDELLRSVSIAGSSISTPGYHLFDFSPVDGSSGADYYYQLSTNAPGKLRVGSAPGNTYISGAQYASSSAQNSQSAFRLIYHPTQMLVGLLTDGLRWMVYLVLALFIFAVPGWAALAWLFPPWDKHNWMYKLCLSIGIGMAFYPLVMLWLNTLRIHSNLLNALLIPVVGVISILLKSIRNGINLSMDQFNLPAQTKTVLLRVGKWQLWQQYLPDLAFIIILIVILFTRIWPVRSLAAPLWGDSYQHTMMAQLLVDNGGLFLSWAPYAELESFTYHFGFHALVSGFHWFSGIDVTQSTLVLGQILNVFAIMALYPLSLKIGKNKWAGVFAVLIAGLVSSMPMYYVNWGRYTQLAGQVILPGILVVIWTNLEKEPRNPGWYSLVWLGLAGLALTHYRVTIFIPLFYVAFFLFKARKNNALALLFKTLMHGLGVLILLIPWMVRISEGGLPSIIGSQLGTAASSVSQAAQDSNDIGNLSAYLPLLLWLLLLFAVVWGVWRRNQESNIFGLWWIFILLAGNPNWLRLPGTGVLTNFAVFIAAYIPAGILVGSACADLFHRVGVLESTEYRAQASQESPLNNRRSFIWSGLVFVSIILFSFWYVRPRIRDIHPADHALLTRPDLTAARWIKENLPEDAKFLVNSFFAYGGTAVVGSDGGWWLPLITGRITTQPPLPYVSEAGPRPDFVAFTNDLIALINQLGINNPEVLQELHTRGITHIYVGQQRGTVNGDPLLDVNVLQEDPHFDPIYHEDRVMIFRIKY